MLQAMTEIGYPSEGTTETVLQLGGLNLIMIIIIKEIQAHTTNSPTFKLSYTCHKMLFNVQALIIMQSHNT